MLGYNRFLVERNLFATDVDWLIFELFFRIKSLFMNLLTETIDQIVPLDSRTRTAISHLFQQEQFPKHYYFAQAGEYSSKFAFVQSGVLRAFYQNKEGEQYNKTFFGRTRFLGAYSSLLTGQKNLIDIQCLTDCELLTATYRDFTALYESYPKAERLARLLAEQYFIQKEKREIELVMLEAKERYEIFKAEHPGLDQRIPQYHIASYLGITPTQLSRIRSKK